MNKRQIKKDISKRLTKSVKIVKDTDFIILQFDRKRVSAYDMECLLNYLKRSIPNTILAIDKNVDVEICNKERYITQLEDMLKKLNTETLV